MAGLVEARVAVEDFLAQKNVLQELQRVSTGFLEPEKVLRFALNAVNTTPRLRECTLKSWMGCLMTAAGLGLEPNTVLDHAWLIPYKNRRKIDGEWVDVYEVQYMIGYKGLINLSWRNPNQTILLAGVACEGDEYKGRLTSESETGVLFEYAMAKANRGEPEIAFCFTRQVNERGHKGDALTELDKAEVLKLRSRSMTYRTLSQNVTTGRNERERQKAQQKFDETPWVLWEEMMWTKCAIRRHSSYLPLSPAMAVAAKIDALSDEMRFDFEAMANPEVARAVMAGELDAPTVEASASEPLSPGDDAGDPRGDEPPPPKAPDPDPDPAPPAQEEAPQGNGRRARGTAKPAAATQEPPRPEEPPPAQELPPPDGNEQPEPPDVPPPLEGIDDTSILFGE